MSLMQSSYPPLTYLSSGLMTQLDERTVHAAQAIFPLIAGLGLGMCFHAPYQVFTKTLAPKEIASGTSAFFLVRFTGATVGLVSGSRSTLRND